MVYIDFTQIYSSLCAVMMVGSGCYTLLVDRRGYASRGLMREAKWSKRIGIAWVILGIGLYLTEWIWRQFIW
jgi:hypothetical protein